MQIVRRKSSRQGSGVFGLILLRKPMQKEEEKEEKRPVAGPAVPEASSETQKKKKKKRNKKKKDAGPNSSQPAEEEEDDDFDEDKFKALPIHQFFEAQKLRLNYDRKKGRHVVAVAPFQTGDLVFESAPYSAVVVDSMHDQVCHRCFGTAEILYVCGGCKYARFCSTQCMNQFSKTHVLECKTLSRLGELKLESETAPIRMLVCSNLIDAPYCMRLLNLVPS